jgi:predicted nucleic acid-binding protein
LPVCVDASFLIKLFVTEPDRALVQRLWAEWAAGDEEIVAPLLIDYEVAAILRMQAFRRAISPEQSQQRWAEYLLLDIPKEHDAALVARALEIAVHLGQPRTYDAAYIALAERIEAPLWTADTRLWNAAHDRFPFLRLLGVS